MSRVWISQNPAKRQLRISFKAAEVGRALRDVSERGMNTMDRTKVLCHHYDMVECSAYLAWLLRAWDVSV